ncbi:MAG: MFS transporter [Candidatus Melainabacteria bacterium]
MSDSFAALKEPDFARYAAGNFLFQFGKQMLVVAVGWQIYDITRSPMALGYVGLAQVIPVFLLTLHAGHTADHYNRRNVVLFSQVLMGLATLALLLLSVMHAPVWGWYVCLFLMGCGRAFYSPANAALVPQIVSTENFTNAITWSSVNFQVASVLGPALGGLLIAWTGTASVVYGVDAACILCFAGLLLRIHPRTVVAPKKDMTLKTLGAGLAYVRHNRIILAAITLDLFAVLFGGAITLLPVYARDILHVGPNGLGLLQAAPSLGAILMALIMARLGTMRKAGALLLWAVAGFGLATIGFGLSRLLWLSALMLFLTGLLDNISMVIRQALVQLRTPDAMRGRVSAINYVFIGASNELGGFESGLVAHWFGPVISVVSGGVMTIVTVILTACLFPALRRMDRLAEDAPAPDMVSAGQTTVQ